MFPHYLKSVGVKNTYHIAHSHHHLVNFMGITMVNYVFSLMSSFVLILLPLNIRKPKLFMRSGKILIVFEVPCLLAGTQFLNIDSLLWITQVNYHSPC